MTNYPIEGKRTLSEFRSAHEGKQALVLGTGPSMMDVYNEWRPSVDIVIGVNKVGLHVPVDYLLILDGLKYFPMDKMPSTEAREVIVSCHKETAWRRTFPDLVIFYPLPVAPHEEPKPPDWCQWGYLPGFNGSNYAATALAYYLGCSRAILGGVDLVGRHSWTRTTTRFVETIEAFSTLAAWCAKQKKPMEVVNGSEISKLRIPKVTAPRAG